MQQTSTNRCSPVPTKARMINNLRLDIVGRFLEAKLTVSTKPAVPQNRQRTVIEEKLSTTPRAVQTVFGVMPRSRIALEDGEAWALLRFFWR